MPDKSPSRQDIAIALTRMPRGLPQSILVLFVPSDNTWNDFGLRVHADVGIRTPLGDFEWVNGFLAFQDEEDSRRFVEKLVASTHSSWVAIDNVQKPFASMLRDIKAYQQFIRLLGLERANAIASAANDVALAYAHDQKLRAWPNFASSVTFSRAFMRISEAVFAYENAGTVFAGQTLDAEDARQDFTAVVRLRHASLIYPFQFPRTGITDNRLSVIIGRNGTGKTASLIALGRRLLDRNARKARLEPSPLFNQLLIYAHSRSLRRFKLSARSSRAASQKIFSLDPTKPATSRPDLTAQLARMIRESDYLHDPLRTLIDVVASEFQGISIAVPVTDQWYGRAMSLSKGRYAALEDFRVGGEQARLDRIGHIDTGRPLAFIGPDREYRILSLGQDVFITFALHAIAKSGPASVFLVDEPENFLHPNLVSRFVRLLHSVLQSTKSIAIIATHSPYVVREVQRSQVHVLSSEGTSVVVQHPRVQTFGANISAISDHIFGDDMVEHLHIQLLLQSDLQDIGVDRLLERAKEELSLDALMLLREERERRQDGNT